MTLSERSALLLAFVRVLHVNGQSTDQTLNSAERLAGILGLRATVLPRWGELFLTAEDGDARLTTAAPAEPTGVDMDRVVAAMQWLEVLPAGGPAPAAAVAAIGSIERKPPAPTWLFALAAAAGAVALAVVFGDRHAAAAALIFIS